MKENNRNNQFASMSISSMLSFILVVCIIAFNFKKIDTHTTEDAMYAFEIIQEKKYKNVNNEANKESNLRFVNNLDLKTLIPKQIVDFNKFSDININVFEIPEDKSMKPCKYGKKCFN